MINNSFENKDQQSQKPAEPRQPPDPVGKRSLDIWMKWYGWDLAKISANRVSDDYHLICIVLWFMESIIYETVRSSKFRQARQFANDNRSRCGTTILQSLYPRLK